MKLEPSSSMINETLLHGGHFGFRIHGKLDDGRSVDLFLDASRRILVRDFAGLVETVRLYLPRIGPDKDLEDDRLVVTQELQVYIGDSLKHRDNFTEPFFNGHVFEKIFQNYKHAGGCSANGFIKHFSGLPSKDPICFLHKVQCKGWLK